jgi:hypothetical protein
MQFNLPGGVSPLLISPRQAAALLGIDVRSLKHLALEAIPVPTRGAQVRRHVRYRLADVLAYGRGGRADG